MNVTTAPTFNGIVPERIPSDLRERNQWVVWREELRNPTDKKKTKIPYQTNGDYAKSDDPSTWTKFAEAYSRYKQGGYNGIGYMFSGDDGFTGVDLDGCRNPETGQIADWARPIIERFDTYTEVSPSKSGVKLFVRGKSPFPKGKQCPVYVDRVSDKTPGIEIYDHKRYFAVTGHEVETVSPRIEERQPELDDFGREWWPQSKPSSTPLQHNGINATERARKYLAKMPAAVSGQQGHNATYSAACALVLGFDLSPNEAFPLLAEWNQSCDPPWSDSELWHKLNDANDETDERGYLLASNGHTTLSDAAVIGPANVSEQNDESNDAEATRVIEPVSFRTLADDYRHMKPVVIDGLARRGEIVNVIADPKRGKSWLAYYILLCVVTKQPLFGRFASTQGRVLLIDNELHPETISHRIPVVAEAMGIDAGDYCDQIDVVSLRGRLTNYIGLSTAVSRIEAGEYAVIVVDAHYRMLTPGVSENDNAAMASIYNMLDQYAAATNAAWMLIHHSTKGSQSEKRTTDVGAGAGSQSRAADTHLVLREHEEPNCVVLDAAVRSFPPVEPMVLQWSYPLWSPREDMNPAELKGRKTGQEQRQDQRDVEGIKQIADALLEGPATIREIRRRTGGMGKGRVERLLDKMESNGDVVRNPVTIRGNNTYEYELSDGE